MEQNTDIFILQFFFIIEKGWKNLKKTIIKVGCWKKANFLIAARRKQLSQSKTIWVKKPDELVRIELYNIVSGKDKLQNKITIKVNLSPIDRLAQIKTSEQWKKQMVKYVLKKKHWRFSEKTHLNEDQRLRDK